MSRLYLLTLLHELIDLLKEYLIYAGTLKAIEENSQMEPEQNYFLMDIDQDHHRQTEDIFSKHFPDRDSDAFMFRKQSSEINSSQLNSTSRQLLSVGGAYNESSVSHVKHSSREYSQNYFSGIDQANQSTKYVTVTSKKQKNEEIKISQIFAKLPDNLVKVFEIIVNLSVANENIVQEAYPVFFKLFKDVIQELNLFTIIKMNKRLVSKCQILMRYNKKQSQRNVKVMTISLDCFHEFVKILNKKLKENRESINGGKSNVLVTDGIGEEIKTNQLLEMFKGIVDFILKALYGQSESVTQKIYVLLNEILDVEKGMEEVVARSLFESVKSFLNESQLQKTSSILINMFELISAVTFMRLLHFYSKKTSRRINSREQRFVVNRLICLVTSALVKKRDIEFELVSKIIFCKVGEQASWILL